MKLCVKLLLILLAPYCMLNAVIVERDSLLHIYEFLKDQDPAHTLVAFDIDNTIARTKGILGSDQWFYGMFPFYAQEQGISYDEAILLLLVDYFAIQKQISLFPTEPAVAPIIDDLQAHGYCVLGLTARSASIIERTHEQLSEMDVHFTRTKNVSFDALDGALTYPYHYRHGIVFCGSNNKGLVVFRVLDSIHIKPRRFICIDDKLKNLHAIEQEAEKRGIEFIGIRYSRMDEEVSLFDPIEGDRLLQAFKETGALA